MGFNSGFKGLMTFPHIMWVGLNRNVVTFSGMSATVHILKLEIMWLITVYTCASFVSDWIILTTKHMWIRYSWPCPQHSVVFDWVNTHIYLCRTTSSSVSFTPCGAPGIHEELPSVAISILSPWPHSMIFLCSLFRPLFSFATFSSAYLFFYTPEDSNPMRFSLLLPLLYVMYVLSNSIFFFLSEFLLVSAWYFSIVLYL